MMKYKVLNVVGGLAICGFATGFTRVGTVGYIWQVLILMLLVIATSICWVFIGWLTGTLLTSYYAVEETNGDVKYLAVDYLYLFGQMPKAGIREPTDITDQPKGVAMRILYSDPVEISLDDIPGIEKEAIKNEMEQ